MAVHYIPRSLEPFLAQFLPRSDGDKQAQRHELVVWADLIDQVERQRLVTAFDAGMMRRVRASALAIGRC